MPRTGARTSASALSRAVANINAATPPVVVHVGDTHGDRTCNTPLMKVLRGFMDEISAPVLYTPGDNEWTDCGGKDSEVRP